MAMKIKPTIIDGDIARVTLTRGYEAIIDAEDAADVGRFNWCAHVCPRKGATKVYAARGIVIPETGRIKYVLMHRYLLAAAIGFDIDHADGDGLNNRRVNIRFATRSQNMQNLRMPITNTSGFKGVFWHKASMSWTSSITANGKKHYLGLFATPEAAHAAYCNASAKLHGEFGRVS